MLARLRPYVLLFLGLNVVYHANFRPIDSSDTLPASLIPFSVVLDHSVTLDRFFPWLPRHIWYTPYVTHRSHGHHFSGFPIGGALLVSPLYVPIALAARHWDPGALVMLARIAEKFAAAAIAALSAVLLLLLVEANHDRALGLVLTLVYAFATETWSISSQALWQHGPGELAIIGCFYCLERWSAERATQRMVVAVRRMCGCGFHHSPDEHSSVPGYSGGDVAGTCHIRLLCSSTDIAADWRRAPGRL